MISTFNIHAADFRLATQIEIDAARAEDCAPRVMFACTACGLSHWHAKNIALGSNGGYDWQRNIYYDGESPECSCSPSALKHVVAA